MYSEHLIQHGYTLNRETGIWVRPLFSGIAYSDGEQIEDALEKAIDSCTDRSVYSPELAGLQNSWAATYHLSSSRSNLLKPVEHLLKKKSVLEIGSGCGAITRHLGELGAEVLALEGSGRRARIGRKRTQDLSNVTILNERFGDFKNDLKFDVVTLIGVLEYAAMFWDAAAPHLSMLEQASSLVKPGGILLVAIENQLGLKYFAGALEDHLGEPFYGIEDRYALSQPKTFGRKELLSMFSKAGLQYTETLAPFPDYKLPSVIITQTGFEHPKFNASALIGPTESADLQSPKLPVFSQSQAWPAVIRNGLGLDLANSFLVVASNAPLEMDSNVLAYHFSANRSKEHAKCSIFRSNNLNSIEISREYSKTQRTSTESNTPSSEQTYHSGSRPLVEELYQILTSNRTSLDDVVGFFERYRKIVCTLAGIQAKPDATLPSNYLDAIPQNILIQGDKWHLIDCEWKSESILTFDWLLFRAIIHSLNSCRVIRLKNEEGEQSLQDFVKRIFEHLGEDASERKLESIAKLESKFQEKVNPTTNVSHWESYRDKPIRKPDIFISQDTWQKAHESAVTATHNTELHLNRVISALTQHNSELERSIREIKESTSWKLTAPLRRVIRFRK